MDYGSRPVPAGDTESGRTVVTLNIPACPEYIVLLRSACGHLAPRLGCTLAETADLRLAVDEASGFLLRNCITLDSGRGPGHLTADFALDGPALSITLGLEADVFIPPDGEEFGWAILEALVDEFSWRVEGSSVRVEVRKVRADGR